MRGELRKIHEMTSVQWNLLHFTCVDHRRHRGRADIHQRAARLDLTCEEDATLSAKSCFTVIPTSRTIPFTCAEAMLLALRGVLYRNGGVWYGSTGGVRDRALNGAGRLPKGKRRIYRAMWSRPLACVRFRLILRRAVFAPEPPNRLSTPTGGYRTKSIFRIGRCR